VTLSDRINDLCLACKEAIATPALVQQSLCAQNLDYFIGEARRDEECPLALILFEALRTKATNLSFGLAVSVGICSLQLRLTDWLDEDNPGPIWTYPIELPRWAQIFVAIVDSGETGEAVTVGRARECLARARMLSGE
jgi:hypothetical protein